jgi:ribosome-binding factor A
VAPAALHAPRPHLQRLIGAQVILKRTPRLTFRADPAIAAGSRVEELLRGLDKDHEPPDR